MTLKVDGRYAKVGNTSARRHNKSRESAFQLVIGLHKQLSVWIPRVFTNIHKLALPFTINLVSSSFCEESDQRRLTDGPEYLFHNEDSSDHIF